MNIYYMKKRYTISFAILSVLGFFAGLYYLLLQNDFWMGILLIIVSPALLYFYFRMTAEYAIITTDEFIKKKTFKKEEICNWEWIRSIKTKKYYYPYYVCYTYINWSINNEQRQEYSSVPGKKSNKQDGELVIESRFSDYKQILAFIVSKTKGIDIDETTRKIIEEVKK